MLKRSSFNTVIFVLFITVLTSCVPIRHYTVTRRTQKWEKEHFDPDRPVFKKHKAKKTSSKKSNTIRNRVG